MRELGFLYFDLGNVLLHFDHEIACRQMAEVAGVSTDRVREAVFDSGLELRYERGELTTAGFYDEFCQRTGTQPPRAPLMDAASRIFSPNQPVFDLVERLAEQSLPLGILSNTCAAHWDHVTAEYPLLDHAFAVRTLSYEVVSLKPEPRIYQLAVERAGCGAAAMFFVDDRLENVAAALDAGWDAVHYRSADQLRGELQSRSLL